MLLDLFVEHSLNALSLRWQGLVVLTIVDKLAAQISSMADFRIVSLACQSPSDEHCVVCDMVHTHY